MDEKSENTSLAAPPSGPVLARSGPDMDLARPRLTAEQLGILQHALGVDKYGRGQMYRNHFCAGGDDMQTCRELVEMGYMETFTRPYLPYYNCTATEAGKAAMLAESPKPPKLTRSQKRYREFLDADSGLSFIEWLKYRKQTEMAQGVRRG